MFNIGK
jgi:hypothetical protein